MQCPISSEADIASSSKFSIAETATFLKRIESREYGQYYKRIVDDIYPRLRCSPYFGPNIKRLKGNLKSIYRYRIGSFRLFCTIDHREGRVYILELEKRKDAYRK